MFPAIAKGAGVRRNAVELAKPFDLRQFIDYAAGEQKRARRNALTTLEDGGEAAILALNMRNFPVAEFDRVVRCELFPADFKELRSAMPSRVR